MTPKLSFIVPVYNVEQYLRKCVESLIKQDYSNYEIILVDDGSTDGSGVLCDEIVRELKIEDRRLKNIQLHVIHQENGGLSAARNAGLNVVKGEYVCFVDSDDYWEKNVLGGLMSQVKREKLDVLRFDYQNVRIADNVQCKVYGVNYEVFEPNKTPRYIDKKNDVVDGVTYLNTRMGYACYSVMYIIKRCLIVKSEELRDKREDCLFTEGIHYEDVDWLPRMMLRAKRVNSTPTIVYNYLVRQGSITKVQGDTGKIRKNLEDRLLIVDKYRHYREQYPECKWLYSMQSGMAEGVLTTVAREFFKERKEYIARLDGMKALPLAILNQRKTYKRRARFINAFGARMYCVLMHYV